MFMLRAIWTVRFATPHTVSLTRKKTCLQTLACFPKQGASRLGNFFSLPWLGESKPAHQGMRFHLVDVKQYHLIIVHCRVRHHFCHLIVCVHLR